MNQTPSSCAGSSVATAAASLRSQVLLVSGSNRKVGKYYPQMFGSSPLSLRHECSLILHLEMGKRNNLHIVSTALHAHAHRKESVRNF